MTMLKLTQEELKGYYEEGKTQVFGYRKAYQIEICHGVNGYVLRELERLRIYRGIGYTKRGRYVAFTVKNADILLALI